MTRDDDDDDALDGWIDHGLQQQLGGKAPPDFAARIAAASLERLAAADAVVDAAAVRAQRGARRWLWLAAAAVLLGLGALAMSWLPGQAPVAARAQALLDRFHAVMPREPVMLRDAPVRADVAAACLPVIREILALHRAQGEDSPFGVRAVEFEIYALELGDDGLRRELEVRAADGDRGAAAQLAVAAAAIGDGAARAAALAQLAQLLPQLPMLASCLVFCLTTTDLTVAEAEPLAAALPQPELQHELRRFAERSSGGPRRLIGSALELSGRLVDDRIYSTRSLRGRVVLVCVWASWCQPSLVALDRIRSAQRAHPELAVVTVSCDHEPAVLAARLSRCVDARWPTFFDRRRPGHHEFAVDWGVSQVPFVMMLDAAGIVREVGCDYDIEAAVRRQFAR